MRDRKTGKKCDCGNTEYIRSLNESFKFVWECTKCGKHHTYRKVKPRLTEEVQGAKVTAAQSRAIEKLHKTTQAGLTEDVEIKTFIVTKAQTGDGVFLEVSVGKKKETPIETLTGRARKMIYITEQGDQEDIVYGT